MQTYMMKDLKGSFSFQKALLLKRDSREDFFFPYDSLGYDETTKRRFRFPGDLIQTPGDHQWHPFLAPENLIEKLRPYFSRKEGLALRKLLFVPVAWNDEGLDSFLILGDSDFITKMGLDYVKALPELLSRTETDMSATTLCRTDINTLPLNEEERLFSRALFTLAVESADPGFPPTLEETVLLQPVDSRNFSPALFRRHWMETLHQKWDFPQSILEEAVTLIRAEEL